MPGSKTLTGPGLVTVRIVDVEEPLAGEVESQSSQLDPLVSALRSIMAVLAPEERKDLDEAEAIVGRWIKIQRRVRPSSGESGPVVERRVHLKVAVVVLELAGRVHAMRAQAVGDLSGATVGAGSRFNARLRVQVRRGKRVDAMNLERKVASGDSVVASGVFGVHCDRADVVRSAQTILGAADVE